MRDDRPKATLFVALAAAAALAAAGCGGSGGGGSDVGGGAPVTEPGPGGDGGDCSGQSFDGTFAAIQQLIFERHGCTQETCHGSARSGGLELTADVAYQNLIEVPSTASSFPRVLPGDNDRSFLWLKLAAATNPGSVDVAGAPMPLSGAPLSEDELELVRLWIHGGAPETGTAEDTQDLVDGCLPAPEPITIKPLPAPAPDEGVQFVMPPWHLEAGSEHEVCFASYYDITDRVPEEFQDPSGTFFRFRGQELRQDPQSHHLILNLSVVPVEMIHDPSFGEWTCKGGERAGEACEPLDLGSCGSGLCASTPEDGFACIGYGPSVAGRSNFPIGGAQQAQAVSEYPSGVFAQIPMKGILYWNSHAFNLTTKDHVMHARLNYYFAKEQEAPLQTIFNVSRIFAPNAAPYTEQVICGTQVLPRGARLFNLSSHTHQHGKHFTVELPDGTLIYESFVYNDPVDQNYDPPIAFDSPDPAQRTLKYCSLYNNGVKEDGSPDPETVTRFSRLPQSVFRPGVPGRCKPIACVAGKVGAPCDGEGDDAACDSAPGAGDGWCDACPITGGESTQNEMFILIGSYFVEPSAAD